MVAWNLLSYFHNEADNYKGLSIYYKELDGGEISFFDQSNKDSATYREKLAERNKLDRRTPLFSRPVPVFIHH